MRSSGRDEGANAEKAVAVLDVTRFARLILKPAGTECLMFEVLMLLTAGVLVLFAVAQFAASQRR